MSKKVALDQIYRARGGRLFMTGIQALVRLPMLQRERDIAAGLSTAGLVSGYRGSPLGAYDQQLWKAADYLKELDIEFQPGLNEDLAATALWGAQMHRAYGPTRVDGVFGIWYGKGNGVDRTGDVFRNANMLGTAPLGGVLAVGGDDHAAQSSMFPHQTDGIFRSVLMPVLQPATVSEILSMGLAGIALSRFSGLWVGMKTIAEVVESAATITLPDMEATYAVPRFRIPGHGLNWDPALRWPAERTELERRALEERLPAARAWAAANGIDHPVIDSWRRRFVIVTVGKAHQDVMQALEDLGLDAGACDVLGLSVYKVGMSWPLAADPLLAFAGRAEEILVIEEKAAVVEDQIKAAFYNYLGSRPLVTGKTDGTGKPLLPEAGEFTPLMVARALVARLPVDSLIDLGTRLSALEGRRQAPSLVPLAARKPFFCSGCPHNSSTRTPEGSIAGGGIGCHVMALSQPALKTSTFSQMGGEGAQWIGAAPFSQSRHIFQNLGDGTYMHSGLLAIRAAVAAGTNITYKILFNDAVAMTGGQPAEGTPSPLDILAQLRAEGVKHVRLVSDDPSRWSGVAGLPAGELHHRDELDAVQRELRTVDGVSAIVYEQTCAAEKRRRRKRGQMDEPSRALFINPAVCEGCGDCSVQSSCIAVEPLETPFGRKRQVNQSSCNKDLSCLKGFCPSFVELEGAALAKPSQGRIEVLEAELLKRLPLPDIGQADAGCNIVVAGIGGLGVLTIGALLGVAGDRDGRTATVLDFTGLAQKNGAVVSQVRIAPVAKTVHAVRIGEGSADLLLATDLVVGTSADVLAKLGAARTRIVLNEDVAPTADVVTDRDHSLPEAAMRDTLARATGKTAFTIPATRLAEGLFGSAVASNMLLLGHAWQRGLIPLSREAIFAAIEANGVAVGLNKRAFDWGRATVTDLQTVEEAAGLRQPVQAPQPLPAYVDALAAELARYQDAAYAARFQAQVARIEAAARPLGERGEAIIRSTATSAYRLMAYKDEYEVARLYSAPAFRAGLAARFSDPGKISVWLAPPVLSRIDPATGRPKKRRFGPWVFPLLKGLAKLKGLRGTRLDPFGWTAERRGERKLAEHFEALVACVADHLTEANADALHAILALPQEIRGFGPVKEAAVARYWQAHERLVSEAKLAAAEREPVRRAA